MTTTLPAFGRYGMLPAGVHPVSLATVRAVLGFNARREQLCDSLDRCLALMHQAGLSGTVHVDGSFVTDKPAPQDMEITLDVRDQSDTQQGLTLLFYVQQHAVLQRMGIDWYPTLSDNAGSDFTKFFQYAGEKTAAVQRCHPKDPKGILKLTKW